MPKNSYEQEALERIQQMYSSVNNRSGGPLNSSEHKTQFGAPFDLQADSMAQSSTELQNGSLNGEPFDISDSSGFDRASSKNQTQTRNSGRMRSQNQNSGGSQNNVRRNSQNNSRRGQAQTNPSQNEPSQKSSSQEESFQNEDSQNFNAQKLQQNNAPFNAGSDILDSFFKDKEKTLIMLLIALLSNDGADSSLILALMYLII